jgi:starvation-inducible DNA-binding protein
MFRSRIDLAVPVREQVVERLNQQLADTLDLYSQAKQAHWNVKGAEFFQLHELFDMLAAAVLGYVDLIAERVTALGGTARGTVRMAATASRRSDYPLDAVDSLEHVDALAERFASDAATVRAAIDTAAATGDADTADLLTEISRGIDKHLWFLEAHLQGRI